MIEVEPKELRRRIGRVLRAFREKTNRNLSSVAKRAGISTSMLSQIERGMVAPSIDTLFDVCAALGLDIAELFGRVERREPVRIHQSGQRLITESSGARYEQLVTSPDSAHQAEMFLLEVRPAQQVGLGGRGHEGVEMGYVLAGTARLRVGTREYAIRGGDSVSFPSHLPHRLLCDSRRVFRAIWTVLPPHKDYLELDYQEQRKRVERPRKQKGARKRDAKS